MKRVTRSGGKPAVKTPKTEMKVETGKSKRTKVVKKIANKVNKAKRKDVKSKIKDEKPVVKVKATNLLRVIKGKKPVTNELECDLCEFVADSTYFLKIHKEKKHTGNSWYYPCADCDWVGCNQRNLYYHRLDNHPKGRYPCTQCDQTFKAPGHMLAHMKSEHNCNV